MLAHEKHHQIDPIFKQVLEDELLPLKAGVQTEVEISRLPLVSTPSLPPIPMKCVNK